MESISEAEVWDLAGESDPPVLFKKENEDTESAVCLKQFPGCLILGVSSDVIDRAEFYKFREKATAMKACERFTALMEENGFPFEPKP
ncbi:MAG: hypothetical protein AAGL97_04175 [Pseudomonadota bacterium]